MFGKSIPQGLPFFIEKKNWCKTQPGEMLNSRPTQMGWKYTNSTWSVGIGGYILDREGNLLFIFSGPSSAISPKESEREAILFVFKSFISHRSVQSRLQIKTDCLSLVEEFQSQRAGNTKKLDNRDRLNLVSNNFLKLVYARDNINSANELAVQGRQRTLILHAWC